MFDVNDTLHTVDGFGVHLWADQPYGLVELEKLNISYIRIAYDATPWSDLAALRRVTDRQGIKWLSMLWRAPKAYVDQRNFLTDVPGFAAYWREIVAGMDRCGLRPHYIELMNEPDSDGSWSTRIGPADYADLVKLTRSELDRAGLADVGIVGPGLAHLNWQHHNSQWINALDDGAVRSLAVWSTHSWDDGDLCFGGAPCVERHWPEFADNAKRLAADKPVWITEYGTKDLCLDRVCYPHPDKTAGYSSAQSMFYAVRVYELSVALLNSGANVLFYWQAEDKGKSWGYVDAAGNRKPVYHALLNLYPKIPEGARVVRPPDQSALNVYAGAFVTDDRLVIALANDGPSTQSQVIRINGAADLRVLEAPACVVEHRGDPSAKEPDTCRVGPGEAVVRPGPLMEVTLPGLSTLTIVCHIERMATAADSEPPAGAT